MGRVYTIEPKDGERSGKGCRLADHNGDLIRFWCHAAFEDDADEGVALVKVYSRTQGSNFILDLDTGKAAVATFRAWVQIIKDGQDVKPVPNVVFLENASGNGPKFVAKKLEPEPIGA